MKAVHDLPSAVRVEDHIRIPMRDSIHLSARIWRPTDSDSVPVPALLEFIPYRKSDFTAPRDSRNHPYFAAHGYASVRVDLRGSGDSEGVLTDEYLESELCDGEDVIAWLAAQPWCDGAVGMIGISWGGFNGLQIAARRPPALKAIVTVCSTDDRFADDVHYMGGCLLGDNLSWASTMFAYNALPPHPDKVGDRWREMWQERLDGSGLWLATWLEHQYRDAYWKHGSVCEDWAAVQIPVMAVSGWADGYTNAVFRLLSNLKGPRQGIVGPWSHKYPHIGLPGPAVGFLQECLRWWDFWLKGHETGIMEEPMLRAWVQDSVPPTTAYVVRPGRWVGEPSWPSPTVERRTLNLAPDRLVAPDSKERRNCTRTVQSPLSLGLYAGKWCSYSAGPDLAHDQREEDGGALTFTSAPLTEDLELLGAPWLKVAVESNQPVALLAARLSDVREDNQATRLTWGLLNLTHRDSHENPTPLEPGRVYAVFMKLNDMGVHIPAGHRLRLSLSTSYWPMAWAPPKPVALTLHLRDCSLTLPARSPRPEDQRIRFSEPEGAAPLPVTKLDSGRHTWRVLRDLATDEATLEVIKDDGRWQFDDTGLVVGSKTFEWYTSCGNDFASLRGQTYWKRTLEQADWHITTVTRTVLRCDPDNFHIQAELDAYEDDKRVHSAEWDRVIPRYLL